MAPIEANPIVPSDLLCLTNPVTDQEHCALSAVIASNQCMTVSIRHIGGSKEPPTCVIGKPLGGYVIDGDTHHKLEPNQTLALRGVIYTGIRMQPR